MTEFEQAMIILKMTDNEYLHALLCSRDPRAQPIVQARQIAERSAKAITSQCPTVAALLRATAGA